MPMRVSRELDLLTILPPSGRCPQRKFLLKESRTPRHPSGVFSITVSRPRPVACV